MKSLFLSFFFASFTLLAGINAMHAEDKSSPFAQWVPMEDSHKHIRAHFPRSPIHMKFDAITLPHSSQLGNLEVYSAPTSQGLLMLSILDMPDEEVELEGEEFKKTFYSFIIQRMFYQPKAFKNHQEFSYQKTTWDSFPALTFSVSYRDEQAEQAMRGIAVMRNQKLYILFYLNSAQHLNETTFEHFKDSFHFFK